MDAVLRAAAIYAFLLVIFRLSGRRTLAQITTFDFVLLLVVDGAPLQDRMDKARIDEQDVREQARQTQGLERLDQIRYAVLERGGVISIIPK